MLSNTKRIAHRLVSLGAGLISAGAHLRETGDASVAVTKLNVARRRAQVIGLAADAHIRCEDDLCLSLLDSLLP